MKKEKDPAAEQLPESIAGDGSIAVNTPPPDIWAAAWECDECGHVAKEPTEKCPKCGGDCHRLTADEAAPMLACQTQAAKVENMRNELDSRRADSAALQSCCDLLAEALPNYKGAPCPADWTVAAVREVIEQRKQLLKALEMVDADTDRAGAWPNSFTGATISGCQAALARAKGQP